MRRVHRKRCQHGKHALHEEAVEEMRVIGAELCRRADDDAGTCEQGAHMGEGGLLRGDELARMGVDFGQLLRRCRAIGRAFQHAGIGLADQPGDADRIKFIEVGRADRDEAQPLQQRVPRVLGLGDNAEIEFQPGEFPVDEARWIFQADFGECRGGCLIHEDFYIRPV